MSPSKLVRTICYFQQDPSPRTLHRLDQIAACLEASGYIIQTKRVCTTPSGWSEVGSTVASADLYWGLGPLDLDRARWQLSHGDWPENVSFHLDLTLERIEKRHVDFLFELFCRAPVKTFNFTYVFNNPPSSPYLPSARYEQDGFAIGLQPTDLAEGCETLPEWLGAMHDVWQEIDDLFQSDAEFLGLDTSVAPLYTGHSSLIYLINRLGRSFATSVLTDTYITITNFLQSHNPRPIGLCGLMFPTLEDFELAAAYEAGQFPLERNVYLALHCGLGIDTYPIGIDEDPELIVDILRLLQGLSNKHRGKALSARFVSDGQAKIGEHTQFGNPYLKDVTIRPLVN